jgi:hypothetical protein
MGIKTGQLHVDGVRATRATGAVPSAATLATWKRPEWRIPARSGVRVHGSWGPWTEENEVTPSSRQEEGGLPCAAASNLDPVSVLAE